MKVAILGAGAVGCYYGFLLARAGHAVTLIGRPALVEAVRSGGLVLESEAGREIVPVEATASGAGIVRDLSATTTASQSGIASLESGSPNSRTVRSPARRSPAATSVPPV